MPTVTDFVDSQIVHEITPGYGGSITNTLDFSVTGATASDDVQAIKVDAGMQVHTVVTEVLTAEGGVATGNVGDDAGTDSWDAAVNLNATGSNRSAVGTDAYATTTKTYTSANTIDIIPSADLDTAVVRITAYYVRVTNSDGSSVT